MDINPSRPDAQQTGERPLNLSDFAQRNQITEDRVWELIEEGELAARFVNDEILILREQDADGEPEIDLPALSEISPIEADEPSLERWPQLDDEPMPAPTGARRKSDTAEHSRVAALLKVMEGDELLGAREGAGLKTSDVDPRGTKEESRLPGTGATAAKSPGFSEDRKTRAAGRPEPDFFAEPEPADQDDGSLPIDDYRDLLVFAQDAMTRTMELSRQLLATKDELLRMKDERIQQLMTDQQKQEQENRRLRKKVEDLETLCRLTPHP